MISPVIMAGGSGTRVWPLSRGNYPKQFLALHGEETMLQQTIDRLKGHKKGHIWTLTGSKGIIRHLVLLSLII